MAIYRGPGGPGDATADATNASAVADAFADAANASAGQAAASAASALAAKVAAELAETNAETAETNAETAEAAAEAVLTDAGFIVVAADLQGTDTIGTVATNIVNVNLTGNNIANVNTVAGISADVTAVAGDATDIGTVAGIAANVTTVAGISANVTSVAGNSTNINTVATNNANVTTVGTNIANVNTVGGISGNVTTVAGISANVTTVAGISGNVTTVATNNANVTTVAGSIASVNTNATNIANINQNAANIVAIQNASANATAAASSATAAAGSATSASASAAAASAVALGNEPVRHSVRPSLLLDFANTKQLDPRITFTRASTAIYYDGKTVAKAEENLVLQSQDFSTSWSVEDLTVTSNSVAAPDGTTTADTITENTANTDHRIKSTAISYVGGLSYVISVYAKDGDANFIQIVTPSALGSKFANFDIATGVVGSFSTDTAAITSVGNGWYRLVITVTATSTASADFSIGLANSSSLGRLAAYTGTSRFAYLWGAQLEQRSAVTDYTPTTTQPITNYVPVLLSAPANVARFEHNPITSESLGLEIEEQRTNIVLYSEQLDNAAWTKSNTTIIANTIVAPDGTLTSDKVIEDTVNSTHFVSFSLGTGLTTGVVYAGSVYVKAGEITSFRLRFGRGTNFAVFNLTTLTVTNTGTAGGIITPVGNGWYRCSVASPVEGTAQTNFLVVNLLDASGNSSYTGNGYSGIYIWGAQLEVGAFATSYIPTVASQVTRSADVAVMTGTNFSSWYRADEGTVYFESQTAQGTGAYQFSLFGTSTQNRIYANHATVQRVESGIRVNNVFEAAVVSPNNSAPINTFGKGATAYKVNDFGFSWNGAAALTDTSLNLPVVIELDIGNNGGLAGNFLNGTIKKVAYYPKRLTNAELQGVTTV